MVFNSLLLKFSHYAAKAALSLAIAIVLVSSGYLKGRAAGAAKVQKAFDAYRTDAKDKALEAVAKAQAAQRAMGVAFTTLEAEHATKIQTLNTRARSLSERLRDTSIRGECVSTPGVAAFGDSSTGWFISDEDGEHLVSLAKDADVVTEQLKSCIAKYEAARKLNEER